MNQIRIMLCSLAVIITASNLQADLLFVADLDGSQEPSASTATGFGTVSLNDILDTITVDLNWTGLIGGPASAAHIHCCVPPGSNGPVLFPFANVPADTSGSIPEQTFAITPAEVAQLEAGLMYMNIHNAIFPGGEIRGQLLATPEPASIGFIVPGLACLAFAFRRLRLGGSPRV